MYIYIHIHIHIYLYTSMSPVFTPWKSRPRESAFQGSELLETWQEFQALAQKFDEPHIAGDFFSKVQVFVAMKTYILFCLIFFWDLPSFWLGCRIFVLSNESSIMSAGKKYINKGGSEILGLDLFGERKQLIFHQHQTHRGTAHLEPPMTSILEVQPPRPQGLNSNQNKGASFGVQVFTTWT